MIDELAENIVIAIQEGTGGTAADRCAAVLRSELAKAAGCELVGVTDQLHGKPMTVDEAAEAILRFNASHFRKTDKEHARYSIPANVNRDDDIRLMSHVKRMAVNQDLLLVQLAAAQERIAELEKAVSEWQSPRVQLMDDNYGLPEYESLEIVDVGHSEKLLVVRRVNDADV